MHLAVATDRTYLPWCATAVLSCLRSTAERPLHIHVLHNGDLTAEDQDSFASMVRGANGSITHHAIAPSKVSELPSKGPHRGGRVSWLRVLIPDLLPDVDRIIYLDADTLAIESLAPLWTLPLDGMSLAAVPNVVEPSMRAHVAGLGIDDFRRYFNAGVLVMNLARMREDRSFEAIMRHVRSHGETIWYDQDALNVVFQDRWISLHPRWNAQNSYWYWTEWATDVFDSSALESAVTDPAILHFEGPALMKPWHYLCRHPLRDAYRRTLRMTPWTDLVLEERTVPNRMIRRLPTSIQTPAYMKLQKVKARLKTIRRS